MKSVNDQKGLSEAVVSENFPISEALRFMSHEAVMIVDGDGHLSGLLTDGDIRRAFLDGADMTTSVGEVMTSDPMTIQAGLSKEEIMTIMLINKIRHLPVVDDKGRPVGLELLKNQYDGNCFGGAVIMAGGKGTRLRPLTYDVPKPLLKVGDQTILDNVLSGLKSNGVQDVILSVNYLGDKIKDHIDQQEEQDLNVSFVEEHEALGTAGALSLLNPRPNHSFIVMNADLVTEMDYRAFTMFHHDEGNDLSVCVRKIQNAVPYGVVKLADTGSQITKVEEKPVYSYFVNAGIYMLEPKIIDLVPKGSAYDMVSLIEKAISSGYRVGAFPILEYWRDIGQHDEMAQAQKEWLERTG